MWRACARPPRRSRSTYDPNRLIPDISGQPGPGGRRRVGDVASSRSSPRPPTAETESAYHFPTRTAPTPPASASTPALTDPMNSAFVWFLSDVRFWIESSSR